MLIKTRSGYWYEVECKISFADFKNDFKYKWQKHELLKTGEWHPLTFVCRETDEKALSKYESYPGYHIENTGKAWNIYIKGQDISKGEHRRPNYFYYCVPWYLSGKVLPLLPDYAGLLVLAEDGKLIDWSSRTFPFINRIDRIGILSDFKQAVFVPNNTDIISTFHKMSVMCCHCQVRATPFHFYRCRWSLVILTSRCVPFLFPLVSKLTFSPCPNSQGEKERKRLETFPN